MKPLRPVTNQALQRAQVAKVVRELAEDILGVAATVDLPPSKLARTLADLLYLAEPHTIPAERRQRSLFSRAEDGRYYRCEITDQRRVVLTGECLLLCPVCGRLVPLELRRMTNGEEIRNQPRCGPCRSVREG